MSRAQTLEQLEDLGLDREEARTVAAEQTTDVRTTPSVSRICTDYLNTTHPDTGLAVVFVPGEALPDWALAAQQKRNAPAEPEELTIAHKPLKATAAKPAVKDAAKA